MVVVDEAPPAFDCFEAAADEDPEDGLRGTAEEAAGVFATEEEADAVPALVEVEEAEGAAEEEEEESFGLTRFL